MPDEKEIAETIGALQESIFEIRDHVAKTSQQALEALAEGDSETAEELLKELAEDYAANAKELCLDMSIWDELAKAAEDGDLDSIKAIIEKQKEGYGYGYPAPGYGYPAPGYEYPSGKMSEQKYPPPTEAKGKKAKTSEAKLGESPFSTIEDLPPIVKGKLAPQDQQKWLDAFQAAFAASGDVAKSTKAAWDAVAVKASELEWLVGVPLGEGIIGKPIQLFRTGEFQHPKYGKLSITKADLEEMVRNFNANIRGQDIPIDIEHQHDKGAVGWLRKLELRDGELWAVPEWTETGAQLIEEGKFRYISPQYGAWTDPETGQHYDNVLMSVAITNYPFLKQMAPVELSEYIAWRDANVKEGELDMPTMKPEEVKLLSEQIKNLQEELAKEREKVQLMERLARAKRFSEMATSGAWIGPVESHVKFLEALADSFGEDSEQFQFYVSQQNEHANQLREARLFSEIGTAGGQTPLAAEAKIQAKAQELLDSGRAKSLSDALEQALRLSPALYAEADREHKERIRRVG